MLRPTRLLLHGLALLGGLVAGVVGSFLHALGTAFPAGLLVGLALSALSFAAGGEVTGGRTGRAAAALGWLLPVLLLSTPRPEGDLVVAGSGLGYAWLGGGALCAAVAVAWPGGGASSAVGESVR